MSHATLIVLVTLAAVLGLVALIVAALVLRDPEGARRRIEALFRRPPRAPKAPGSDHYYRPYWS